MQAVGELDQDDPDILGHRHHHLAEVFGLGFGLGAELDLRQLRDAFDQIGDLLTELLDQRFLADATIFDDVMHQRRHDALGIKAHAGHDAGDRYWMGDIGLARRSRLAGMGVPGQFIGFGDLFDLRRVQITLDLRA